MSDNEKEVVNCLCILLGKATVMLQGMATTSNQKSKVSSWLKQVDDVIYQNKHNVNELIGVIK